MLVLAGLLMPLTVSGEALRVPAEANPQALANLERDNPDLKKLRQEIADNLKATARRGELRWPVRYVRYRLREGDNFYTVMARVSQDADTLASLNGLANPNALEVGEELLVPNARGLFLSKKEKPAEIARRYEVAVSAVRESGGHYFVAGQKYLPKEMAYFRGDGFKHKYFLYMRISVNTFISHHIQDLYS